MTVFWLLAAMLVVAVLVRVVYRRHGFARLEYRRTFSAAHVFEGDTLHMVEEIANRKLLPLPWLRVESHMPGGLHFHGAAQAHTALGEDTYHSSLFALGPYRKIRRTHTLQAVRRGYYQLETVSLALGDGLGISTEGRTMPTALTLAVYPQLLDFQLLQVESHRWQGDVILRRYIEPDPFLINGIRAWQTGDSLRDVHWAATARSGELQVKSRDFTASPRLYILLNIQSAEDQWGETLDKKQAAHMEYALRMAATYAAWAYRNRVEFAFGCNGRYSILDETPVQIGFGFGESHFYEVMEQMARVRLMRRKAFPSYLEEVRQTGLRGADIVIVSAYWSDALQQRAEGLRAQGNAVQWARTEGSVDDATVA